ncbi:hypothetical protein [Williamsia sp. R60]
MAASSGSIFSRWHPASRIALRWAIILAATFIAFYSTWRNISEEAYSGSLIGYVFSVPWLALLAAQGVARRRTGELPIHDRQTDVIVGFMGLVLALLIKGVLLRRYSDDFSLLHLDLLAMWIFLISASIMLFGLRPVTRFAWVWLLLLMMFPLPYRIMVITLGGGRQIAGLVALGLAAFATAIAVGRTWQRAVTGAALTFAVGGAILLVLIEFYPNAPVMVYQQTPTLTATVVVSLGLYFYSRRGEKKRPLERSINPLTAGEVWRSVPVVGVIAILLAFITLPVPSLPPVRQVDGLPFRTPLISPPQWQTTSTVEYRWVKRFFGTNSVLIRQRMLAEEGNFEWDKLSRPREVVVDSVTSRRPISFTIYPDNVLYDMSQTRSSAGRDVNLGNGIIGRMYAVVDDKLLVTWTKLTWTWENGGAAQRVTVLTVDNHEANAPFPEPANALVSNLNTVFTVLLRGNSVVTNNDPVFKDEGLLTEFGRDLVEAQLAPLKKQVPA